MAWSSDTAETVSDDFQILDGSTDLLASSSLTLAPNETKVVSVSYANNDFSTTDLANLVITHSGSNGSLTIPIGVSFDSE